MDIPVNLFVSRPVLSMVSLISAAFLQMSAHAAITLVNSDSAATASNSGPGDFTLSAQGPGNRDGIYSYNYNAGASFEMLVVAVSREASSDFFGVSYGGVDMNLAAGGTTGSGASIFYLATAASSGTIALDFSTFSTVNGIGIGIAALNNDSGGISLGDADALAGGADSITVNSSYDGAFAIFAGDANATSGSVSLGSPLSIIYTKVDVGSSQAGAGYEANVSLGDQTYSWTPNASPRAVGAAIFVPEPSSMLIFGLGSLLLLRRRRN